jgi:hypothetical protein
MSNLTVRSMLIAHWPPLPAIGAFDVAVTESMPGSARSLAMTSS